MIILEDSSWDKVEERLLQMKEDSIFVNYKHLGYSVSVETKVAGHPWKVAMIVGVTVYKNGNMKIHQWFDSVQSAKRCTRRWPDFPLPKEK